LFVGMKDRGKIKLSPALSEPNIWMLVMFAFGTLERANQNDVACSSFRVALVSDKVFLEPQSRVMCPHFLGENFGLEGPRVNERNSKPLPGAWSAAVSRSLFRKMIMRMSVCK